MSFPEEKKADSLIFLPVRPGRVFTHWELEGKGAPALRFHAVRGGAKGDSFEIGLKGPSGSAYLDIPPGKRFTVHAGMYEAGGKFRSRIISTALAPFAFPRPAGMKRKRKLPLPKKYYEFHLSGATSY